MNRRNREAQSSAGFHALGAVVMAPGLLMGMTALWPCARSDISR